MNIKHIKTNSGIFVDITIGKYHTRMPLRDADKFLDELHDVIQEAKK